MGHFRRLGDGEYRAGDGTEFFKFCMKGSQVKVKEYYVVKKVIVIRYVEYNGSVVCVNFIKSFQ
jgi:hypothetical protein